MRAAGLTLSDAARKTVPPSLAAPARAGARAQAAADQALGPCVVNGPRVASRVVRQVTLVLALTLVARQAAPARAGGATIQHQAVGCVLAGKFPSLQARFDPADALHQARIYFRPEGGRHWYSVAMKPAGGVFDGVLPRPNRTLKSFTYYIEAVDTELSIARTQEYTSTVATGPGACKDKEMALTLASATVAIIAPSGAPLVPSGFSASGVITGGAEAVAEAAGAATGKGIPAKPLLVGGAAVVAAGAAVAASTGGSGASALISSPSPTLSGRLSATVSSPQAGQTVECSGTIRMRVTLTNGTGAAVAVDSLEGGGTPTSGGCGASPGRWTPAVTSVGSGQTATVYEDVFTPTPGCLPGGGCQDPFVCDFNAFVTVTTSVGAVDAGTFPYRVIFNCCPPCP